MRSFRNISKVTSFILVMCVLILTSACNKSSKEEKMSVVFAKNDYGFDDSIVNESGCSFTLTFYTKSKTILFDDVSKIDKAYISLNEENIDIQVDEISFDGENPLMEIDGEKIYIGKVESHIKKLSRGYFDKCNIIFYMKSGEELTYSIGDIVYQDVDSNTPSDFYVTFAEGVMFSKNEEPIINGVVLRFEVPETLTISEIDFGIPTIGLDVSNIKIFNENEYNSKFITHADENTLDKILPNAYTEKITDVISNKCNIEIPMGISYVYIPFTKKSADQPQPERLYANIKVLIDGNQYNMWATSFPFYSATYHSETEIENLFK